MQGATDVIQAFPGSQAFPQLNRRRLMSQIGSEKSTDFLVAEYGFRRICAAEPID